MRIFRSVRHKSCADGTRMKEFLISVPVPDDFYIYLENFGNVQKLTNAGGVFYKFEKRDFFSIKGFSGDTSMEVRFKPEVMDLTEDFLYSLFYFYHDGKPDLDTLKRREENLMRKVLERLYGKKC
ncbi:hypothetical protein F1737_07915 [Methanoplanus sp. FWC-SCC4]|uniref:Uncharacterized protein n=1 Tax=Methanochimaera problematica TaxID=2609417 RepID=A0AA97FE89_9EURY|nr:hypothetical protein [Methanoplanus sp. FWC-SCC4]WOF16624.1 hypothetical protein F1737_07915 [Methanoplanus sp. FWC-SCC4]